jgi:transcriptional regulator with XRE-family HTH domain
MKNGLPAIHPGEFLREILEDREISQAQFSRAVGLSPMRISHVVKGARPVTAELACGKRKGGQVSRFPYAKIGSGLPFPLWERKQYES